MSAVRYFAVLGATEDEAIQFTALLAQAGMRLQPRWQLGEVANADLLLVDIDSVYGHMDWLQAHNSGRLTAVVTEQEGFEGHDLILTKPTTLAAAAALFTQLSTRIETPSTKPNQASSVETAPITMAVEPPGTETPTSHTLIDYLNDNPLHEVARIVKGSAPPLILDSIHRVFHFNGNLRTLAPYCQHPLAHSDWQALTGDEMDCIRELTPAQPYSRLIWAFHALATDSRLLAELDANAKFKLARWPQIEREFPKHFRIATFMLKQLSPLSAIVEQSNAALPEVIDFINAYYAIGYIETDSTPPRAPKQNLSKRGALLSRLRHPFGNPR